MKRMSIGTAIAITLHVVLLLWLVSSPIITTLNPLEMLSAPTNVSIRFISPIEAAPQATPPIEKVTPTQKTKPITKKAKTKPKSVAKRTTKTVQKPTPKVAAVATSSTPSPKKPTAIPIVSEAAAVGKRVTPKYPKTALRMKQEGEVLLRVLISETGKRLAIKTHKPSQYASLNRAAIKAVKKWTFKPYKTNGHATKSWVEIPIEFRIQ